MSNSPGIVPIRDPRVAQHPFRVATLDGYANCATCGHKASNGRHRKIEPTETIIFIEDPAISTQWISAPLALVLDNQDIPGKLAELLRGQLPPLRVVV